ncbi:MAG: RNA polymerase sigma factor [Candidatus Poribacteria bacterium]
MSSAVIIRNGVSDTKSAGLLEVTSMEDVELVGLCQKGDIDAFDKLFYKYRDKIYRTAFRMINNQEDALDLTQEIFLKAYKNINKYNFKSQFSTWLYKLAINVCIDELRKHKRSNEILTDEIPDDRRYSDTPEDIVLYKEQESLIWKALDTLKEKERSIIVLREMEGLSYEEIANILGCSMGRVKSRIHESREKLRKALEKMSNSRNDQKGGR